MLGERSVALAVLGPSSFVPGRSSTVLSRVVRGRWSGVSRETIDRGRRPRIENQGLTTEDEGPRTKDEGLRTAWQRIERIVLGPWSFVPGRSSTVLSR